MAFRDNLAFAYESAGQTGEVISLLERTLVDVERQLGAEHAHTLAFRKYLADAYWFYEHTAQWRMDAWTQWTRGFGIPGAAIESLYGKRVQQLALPVQPLAVAHGVDSEVTEIVDAEGEHAGSAWLRTLCKTGDYMYRTTRAYSARITS